jgi:hypothetical protein
MRGMSDETLYDKRLIERHIRQGLISRDDADKHADKTEDLAARADSIDIDAMIEEMSSSGRRRMVKARNPAPEPKLGSRDTDED